MSIIQDIRDKYAKVAVVAIALALIGFILTDYFSGRGGGGRVTGSKSLGSVNGKTVNADDFARKVQQAEANMRSQGYPAEMISSQALTSFQPKDKWLEIKLQMLFTKWKFMICLPTQFCIKKFQCLQTQKKNWAIFYMDPICHPI